MNLEKNVDLKDYTTYKVGGKADYFTITKTKEDIIEAIDWAKENDINFYILGRGSNVIISDEGIRGLVIIIETTKINIEGDSVKVDAGVDLSDLTKALLDNRKGGLEFLANIPGSVGGAVAGNAGCYGKYIGDYLKEAEILIDGEIGKVGPEFFEFEYRSSKLKKGFPAVILNVTLKIADVDPEKSMKIINEDKDLRETKHPKEPSCGSFYKNPSRENTAGSLIEKCELKGYKLGGAQVSEKHANFIINTGEAAASDLKSISEHIRKTVKEKTGFELEEEVKYLGEF